MLLASTASQPSTSPFGYLPPYLYIRQAHLFVRTGLGVFHCPEPYLFLRSIGSNSTALPPRTDGAQRTRRSHSRTARAPCSRAALCPAARAPAHAPARILPIARSVFCTCSNSWRLGRGKVANINDLISSYFLDELPILFGLLVD